MSRRAFTYDKSWDEIETMLATLERKQNNHLTAITLLKGQRMSKKQRQEAVWHMRQFKGLEGAITSLRWVLGDPNADPTVGVKTDE